MVLSDRGTRELASERSERALESFGVAASRFGVGWHGVLRQVRLALLLRGIVLALAWCLACCAGIVLAELRW